MKKPPHLKKGDTVGIISPASPSFQPSDIVRATETLEAMGYKIKLGPNVNRTKGFTAASAADRAADFNAMLRDDTVDAVFSTQGGYGSAQMVRHIDFDAVGACPKIFTGFSDITSLHLAIHRLAGVVTFHGPGAARFNSEALTDYTKEQFFKALAEVEPLGDIPLANPKKWLNPVARGAGEGLLVGGNMTLVCSSLGTPFEIETDGRVLLLEEVDAEPWTVDHMLCHLQNAGKLDNLAGLIIGECVDVAPNRFEPGYYVDTSLEDVLNDYFAKAPYPVLYGLPLGHADDIATLPLGVRARVDANEKTFTLLESGVL